LEWASVQRAAETQHKLAAAYDSQMDQLPIAPPPLCTLDATGLREQLARYRAAGSEAEVLEWTPRKRVVRVGSGVPGSVIERLLEVERECCPFLMLAWDPAARRLAISVSDREHEPALDAITYALGAGEPA
jgi:hypothetical protein